MFYEVLYAELGKLFHYVDATGGKVQSSETRSIQQLIQRNWKPLESSTDKYGTDEANLIDFAFDYEEGEGEGGFQLFEVFYPENKSRFTPAIVSNILQTGKAIAVAYRSKNRNEKNMLDRVIKLFEN